MCVFSTFIFSVEDKKEKASSSTVPKATSATAAKSPTLAPPAKTTSEPTAVQTVSSSTATTTSPTSTLSPAPLNLANVDLGKISSILNSITNAMKNTGEQNQIKMKCFYTDYNSYAEYFIIVWGFFVFFGYSFSYCQLLF